MKKFLYGYSDYISESYSTSNKKSALLYVERLKQAGFDVAAFNLTLNPPGPALSWKQLEMKWKAKDRHLMELYESLLEAIEDRDVLINASGINLHPEFVSTIPALTLFQCFDDPENSVNLSKPVATSYDACLVGNVAEVDTYLSWGVTLAQWQPLGLQPGLFDPSFSIVDDLDRSHRRTSTIVIADFNYAIRKERLGELVLGLKEGKFYGPGARDGYLPQEKFLTELMNSQIGINIHNSTGPINARTFYLPANGVLQICDNSANLDTVFVTGKEVVAADNPKEMIEAARYFLANPEEQIPIVKAAWKRTMGEYNEVAVFTRIVELSDRLLEQSVPLSRSQLTLSSEYIKPSSRLKKLWAKAVNHAHNARSIIYRSASMLKQKFKVTK